MPASREPSDTAHPRAIFLDRLQALGMLLPAALLAWPGPGAALEHDLVPALTGTGIAALAATPVAAILVLRAAPGRPRGLLLLLLPLLFATLRANAGDTLEASRTSILGWTGLVLLLAGASLGAAGRTFFARGIVALSLLLLVPAHLDQDDLFTGALGNTGSVSQSALAGALVGAAFVAYETRTWRLLGAAALLLEITYALRVPVHAGAVSTAVALGAFAALRRPTPRPVRLTCAVVAASIVASVLLRAPLDVGAGAGEGTSAGSASEVAPQGRDVGSERSVLRGAEIEDAGRDTKSAGDSGGIAVRWSLARRTIALLADHPWLGVGPGQFAVAYPPYRELAEIERTTHARTLGVETEVEHPHDDLLLFLVEDGLLAGLLRVGFFVLVLLEAFRRLRSGDAQGAAFALAALGLLVNALGHAVLSHDAVSASIAYGVFGVLLAGTDDERSLLRQRTLALLAALVLALHAPRAFALCVHGRELAALASDEPPDADESAVIAGRALDAAPDSVLARTLHARALAARGTDRDTVLDAWRSVLALRPERLEALVQIGVLAATAGRTEEARRAFEHALALDPAHPGVLRNIATLAFEEGRVDDGFALLTRLDAPHAPDAGWLVDLASSLYLRGREDAADALFMRVDPELAPSSAEKAREIAQREKVAGRALVADAASARAQRIWARGHAAAARWHDAVRIYRQELRISRDYTPGGAPNVRMESAAASLLSGDEAAARALTDGLAPTAADWARLPAWARDELHARRWFDAPQGG